MNAVEKMVWKVIQHLRPSSQSKTSLSDIDFDIFEQRGIDKFGHDERFRHLSVRLAEVPRKFSCVMGYWDRTSSDVNCDFGGRLLRPVKCAYSRKVRITTELWNFVFRSS
jgi:hypothetical protein